MSSDFADKETVPPYDYSEHAAQQQKRDDESRTLHNAQKARLRAISYPEICQRCGRDSGRLYIWNRKRLCRSCMTEEQEAWTLVSGRPGPTAQRVPMGRPVGGNSKMESLLSGFLALLGLERMEKDPMASRIPMKQPLRLSFRRPDRKQTPKAEGIMGSAKKKYNKRKNQSSFAPAF